MVERRLDCENCRHLMVVSLHDTGPRWREVTWNKLLPKVGGYPHNLDNMKVKSSEYQPMIWWSASTSAARCLLVYWELLSVDTCILLCECSSLASVKDDNGIYIYLAHTIVDLLRANYTTETDYSNSPYSAYSRDFFTAITKLFTRPCHNTTKWLSFFL